MPRLFALAAAAILVLSACAAPEDTPSDTAEPAVDASLAEAPAPAVAEASVVALVFAADWCGTCEELDPKLQAVRARTGDLPVEFVMLDHTDDATTVEAAATAEALGVSALFDDNDGATGHVVLVSRDTGEVLDRIAASDTEAAMEQTLQAAVAA